MRARLLLLALGTLAAFTVLVALRPGPAAALPGPSEAGLRACAAVRSEGEVAFSAFQASPDEAGSRAYLEAMRRGLLETLEAGDPLRDRRLLAWAVQQHQDVRLHRHGLDERGMPYLQWLALALYGPYRDVRPEGVADVLARDPDAYPEGLRRFWEAPCDRLDAPAIGPAGAAQPGQDRMPDLAESLMREYDMGDDDIEACRLWMSHASVLHDRHAPLDTEERIQGLLVDMLPVLLEAYRIGARATPTHRIGTTAQAGDRYVGFVDVLDWMATLGHDQARTEVLKRWTVLHFISDEHYAAHDREHPEAVPFILRTLSQGSADCLLASEARVP